jgi:maleate isomerase
MGIVDPFEIADVSPEQIVDFARREVDPADADLLFVSCTNLRAIEARPALEQSLGLPVMTSNLAALRKAVALSEEVVAR